MSSPGDVVDGVQQHSKRALKYTGDMVRILQLMDRTTSSNWTSLSPLLTQILKCIESNVAVASEVLPDPTLFCRVLWKCLDPKGVMGVHRKALDVLQRLCQCMGAFSILQQMPLLLVGVLELLPNCSMQLKCELLEFVKVYLLIAYPPEVVAVELPGLIAAVVSGFEENETSEVYGLSLQIMENIHRIVNSAAFTVTTTDTKEVADNHQADDDDDDDGGNNNDNSNGDSGSGNHAINSNHSHDDDYSNEDKSKNNTPSYLGDAAVYRALWFTLKNSPPLRGAVLHYFKLRLSLATARADGKDDTVNDETISLDPESSRDKEKKCSLLTPSIPLSIFVGGDARMVHSAIFATLQEKNARKQRLMLDVLIISFPLGIQSVFTFAEESLLVAAAVQLLGLPDVTSSIRRRVSDWLLGPTNDKDFQYVHDVSSFRVAQAFHWVIQCWELHLNFPIAKDTRRRTSEMGPLEESCYQVLYASAREIFLTTNASTSTGMNIDAMGIDLLLIVWLRALLDLFQIVIESNVVDEDLVFEGEPRDAEGDGSGLKCAGNIFMNHVAPLIMPYVCELLVSMELRRREDPRDDGNMNSTLLALFQVIPLEYLTQYMHGIIFMIGGCLDQLEKCVPSSDHNHAITDVGGNNNNNNNNNNNQHTTTTILEIRDSDANGDGVGSILTLPTHPQGLCGVDVTLRDLASSGDGAKLLLDLQVWFQQLHAMMTVVKSHLMEFMKRPAEEVTAFYQDMLHTCDSLGRIVLSACKVCCPLDITDTAPQSTWNATLLACARRLLEGTLDLFHFCFFDIVRTLQKPPTLVQVDTTWWRDEEILLTNVMRSAVTATQLTLRDPNVWVCTLTHLNNTVVSFFFLPTPPCDDRPPLGNDGLVVSMGLLQEWVHSLLTLVNSGYPALEEKVLLLYVDLVSSNTVLPLLHNIITERYFIESFAERLWQLLGTCATEMQPRMVDMLIQMYGVQKGRDVLDIITTEETIGNGERLILLFRLLGERETPQEVFLPGLFMMLRALTHGNVTLRWLAQSMIRQSLSNISRVLDPLFTQFAQSQSNFSDGCIISACGDNSSTCYLPPNLKRCETLHIEPREFVSIIRHILMLSSCFQGLVDQLQQMQPPLHGNTVLSYILRGLPKAVHSRIEGMEEAPSSALAVLSYVLLAIARRSLSLLSGKMVMDDLNRYDGELCLESCEALHMLLERSWRAAHVTETTLQTWRCTSVYMLSLLRDAVDVPSLPPAQVLILHHLIDTVRFLNANNGAGVDSLLNIPHTLHMEGGDATTTTTTTTGSLATGIGADKMKSCGFHETVAVGIERAAAAAHLQEWANYDLLSLWCDTVLQFLPYCGNERGRMSIRLVNIFLRFMDNIVHEKASLTNMATSRVVVKCIESIYHILEYHFNTTRQLQSDNTSSKKSNGNGSNTSSSNANWFSAHVPIFGANSSSSNEKGVSAITTVMAGTEVVQLTMEQIVLSLVDVYLHTEESQKQRQEEWKRERRKGSVKCSNQVVGVPASSPVGSAIQRVLRLCGQELGAEFIKTYMNVWANTFAQPIITKLVFSSSDIPGREAVNPYFSEVTGENGESPARKASGVDAFSELMLNPCRDGDSQFFFMLLQTGVGATAESLIRVAEELLAQRPSLSGSQRSSRTSRLPFDAVVFYFIHAFLRVCGVPGGDATQVLSALIDMVTLQLSNDALSVLALPFVLLVLADFAPINSVVLTQGSDETDTSIKKIRDKRFISVICKVLDLFKNAPTNTKSKLDPLHFSFKVISLTLSMLPHGTAEEGISISTSDQDRLATSAVGLYKRCLLPTFLFGIDTSCDADVHKRAPLVRAALSIALVFIEMGGAVSRRLRQEFLEILLTCDLFQFSQATVHAWTLVFERLSQDQIFHAEAMQIFAPYSSTSNRILSLLHSFEEEERQRVRQMKRLVFYVMSVPRRLLVSDMVLCVLLRERITETLRLSSSSLSSDTSVTTRTSSTNMSSSVVFRRVSNYRSIRHTLFLFRVLMTKLDPVLLRPFWPLVLPEVLRTLSLRPSVDNAVINDGKHKGLHEGEELLALQMECLKLLDFAVVIMPEAISTFRWVFFDDINVIGNMRHRETDMFTPIVCRLVSAPPQDVAQLSDVWALTPVPFTPASITNSADWSGYQRPLLRFPPMYYVSLKSIHASAAALSLFSQSAGVVVIWRTPHEDSQRQQLVEQTRLLDGWDEAYVESLVEADFSCVAEEKGQSTLIAP